MHKAILMVLLTVVSSSALAEWFKVKEDETLTSYANIDTIRKKGDKVKMWTMTNFNKVTPNRDIGKSYKALDEYDCKEEKSRNLQVIYYPGSMGVGLAVSDNSEHGKWKAIIPDTVGEVMWKIACGKL